jgi:hypothetical protein
MGGPLETRERERKWYCTLYRKESVFGPMSLQGESAAEQTVIVSSTPLKKTTHLLRIYD